MNRTGVEITYHRSTGQIACNPVMTKDTSKLAMVSDLGVFLLALNLHISFCNVAKHNNHHTNIPNTPRSRRAS